ncbi:Transcriptional coactivator Hfi1/Transcriptional adapter 1 [Dillenia turbinata]|uniref:Transcriptional coactivator Hfi1/Transcriptional adapter 1 n=1 Tax=Dillenia turbinata TaxID=194707 RepID=A0AAN8UIC9_9MAGN
MQPPQQLHSRINLGDLRAQIVKKIGPERSKHYFHILNRFLSLKMTKTEFNRMCIRVVGRENIQLHNQFIYSILKNACHAKVPPRVWSNGETVPSSKVHERRVGDSGCSGSNMVFQNGDLTWKDVQKPTLCHQGEVLVHERNKLSLTKGSPLGVISVNSRDQLSIEEVEDWKTRSARNQLYAPLGIPFCSASVGGAHKALPVTSSNRCTSLLDHRKLVATETLRKRMEQIATAYGLEGVSVDCANLLNFGLDAYLKGLLRSSVELVGSRSGNEAIKNSIQKHQSPRSLLNESLEQFTLITKPHKVEGSQNFEQRQGKRKDMGKLVAGKDRYCPKRKLSHVEPMYGEKFSQFHDYLLPECCHSAKGEEKI